MFPLMTMMQLQMEMARQMMQIATATTYQAMMMPMQMMGSMRPPSFAGRSTGGGACVPFRI